MPSPSLNSCPWVNSRLQFGVIADMLMCVVCHLWICASSNTIQALNGDSISTPEFPLVRFCLKRRRDGGCHPERPTTRRESALQAGERRPIARRIASILDVPHIELDSYRYGPNWTKTPDEVVRDRLNKAVQAEAWVADGNYYRMARDIVWPRATTVRMARLLDPRGHVEAVRENDAPRHPSRRVVERQQGEALVALRHPRLPVPVGAQDTLESSPNDAGRVRST